MKRLGIGHKLFRLKNLAAFKVKKRRFVQGYLSLQFHAGGEHHPMTGIHSHQSTIKSAVMERTKAESIAGIRPEFDRGFSRE